MLPVSGGVLFKKSNKVSRDFAFCGTSNDKLHHIGDWDLLCVLDQNMKRSACDRDLEVVFHEDFFSCFVFNSR